LPLFEVNETTASDLLPGGVVKESYIKVFDRTVLEAAEKMQKRIEELRQSKEHFRQLGLSFGGGGERPRTVLEEHPAFSRLADSSFSGQHLASLYLEYHGKLFELMLTRLE